MDNYSPRASLRRVSLRNIVDYEYDQMLGYERRDSFGRRDSLTSENFYQAMKLPKENLVARKEIADMTPYGAKRNIKKYTYRESWNQEESLKVMEYILKIKFRLGTKFHKKLKMTEDWEITEWNNWKDNFWGKDIQSGLGENHLGKLLMKIRA